jgi:predicted nuclease of predicted toxin-antitoxin system
LRLIVDECCQTSTVAALRSAGHDVIYVRHSAPGISDEEVAAWALADDRILITEDYDFGGLVVRLDVRLPALVILAPAKGEPELRPVRLVEVLKRHGEALRGQITIIESERERTRPFAVGGRSGV